MTQIEGQNLAKHERKNTSHGDTVQTALKLQGKMAHAFLVLVILLLFHEHLGTTVPLQEDASLLISVNPERQQLIDSLGRERFFHGTNVVYKHFPFHPTLDGYSNDSFSEVDMQIMQDLGLNVIRLGMMLPGYVPKRGQYNETYLETIKTIVLKAAKYGIYTLLDMHQDVMSPKFCVEGFPDWAVNTGNAASFPFPLEDKYPLDPSTGYPYQKDCDKHNWGDYYFSEAAAAAFQNLYNNTGGLLDAWADFWRKTAQGFEDVNSVIGYELINEPFAGDIYRDPTLMAPGIADEKNLAPAYEALHKAIREVDTRHSLFFEGVTWDFFAAGFKEVPGGKDFRNRSILSYHYYEPPDFNKKFQFEVRKEDLKRLQCGGVLSEFWTAGSTNKALEDMFEIMDITDEHMQSWMGWLYKAYGCDKNHLGCLISPKGDKSAAVHEYWLHNTSRTYPQAVAGHTIAYKYNRYTHRFDLHYLVSSDCKSTVSVVYINEKLHYPKGYQVTVSPLDSVTWHQLGNQILINHSKDLLPWSKVAFTILPK